MLPYLYRHVAFHVFWLKQNLYNMFTPTNQGLPHIRSLRIEDSCTPMFDNFKHLPVLGHLLTVIPKNVLRIFESVQRISLDTNKSLQYFLDCTLQVLYTMTLAFFYVPGNKN